MCFSKLQDAEIQTGEEFADFVTMVDFVSTHMEKVCPIIICSFLYIIYDNSVLTHITTAHFIHSNMQKIYVSHV